MNSNLNDEENTFICLDDSCLVEQKVIKTAQDMFLHNSHKDVRCLKDIRTDIKQNQKLINLFMVDIDLDEQSSYVEGKSKEYQIQSKQLDQNAFFENKRNDLMKRYIYTGEVQTILNCIRGQQIEKLELKGDYKFLKNIKDLPNHSKRFNEQFLEDKKEIQEYMQNIRTILSPNGDRFKGRIVDNIKTGYGEYYWTDGRVYNGQWSNNKMNGEGEFRYVNGDRYIGNWVENKRNGQGEFQFFNGNRYIGNHVNDKINGQGEMIFVNGNRQIGNWVDGYLNGKGEMIFVNGDRYIGNYIDSKRNGYGEMTFLNGDRYIGNWLNDERHGQGKMIFVNGDRYFGNYVDDKRNGLGEIIFPNGDRFIGNYIDDKRNGQAEYQSINGNFKGLWSNDIQI